MVESVHTSNKVELYRTQLFDSKQKRKNKKILQKLLFGTVLRKFRFNSNNKKDNTDQFLITFSFVNRLSLISLIAKRTSIKSVSTIRSASPLSDLIILRMTYKDRNCNS